ncbi:MAG: peroxiredoxin, partial [Burkholderiaceae bacterium]|nr:peroxiredoxin [Burkholderiaceae bacterium]
MTIKIGQTMPMCEIPATSNLTFSPKAYQGKKLV